jgi:hypothetical protein
MEQYLIEIYDKEDYETLIDDYVSVETEEEAQRYTETMALQVQTENYGTSIRNVKDI